LYVYEIAADPRCTVGEGPLWHPDEERIYWVDNIGRKFYRHDPATGTTERVHEGDLVAAFTIQADGSLLLFMDEGRIVHWDEGETTPVVDSLAKEDGMRFNDVIAGPEGRVLCGTMDDDDPTAGRLYRLEVDGSITEVLERVELANGLGFTPDRERVYLTETNTNRIYRFRYDRTTGEFADRNVFSERAGPGAYDGLTVDEDGSVWSALWDYGGLVEHAPDGTVERVVDLPTRNVTSVTFGGSDYADTYVTTAAYGTDDDELAGALLRVDLGVTGAPEFRSGVDV
jgi:D-xylonolactonase